MQQKSDAVSKCEYTRGSGNYWNCFDFLVFRDLMNTVLRVVFAKGPGQQDASQTKRKLKLRRRQGIP
jgi:hypothetical protein